ncbi:MAG: hypothetical protein H7096_04720 [Flavobacterium sp.]|nr:hypothetical protein [Pedobacter sp.]
MKKLILTLCVALTFLACKAQSVSTKSTGKQATYSVSRHEGKLSIIKNEKNRFYQVKQNFPPSALVNGFLDLSSVRYDNNKVIKICADILTFSRLKVLQSEKDLSINIYFNDQGQVLETLFLADLNTKLSAKELEEIELEIKDNIKATFTNNHLKGVTYIDVTSFINFEELLKIKQGNN